MNQKNASISEPKSGKDFSKSERHKIIQEYLSSGKTKRAIWQKYTGQAAENGQLLVWMKQLGYANKAAEAKRPTVPATPPRAYRLEEKLAIIEAYRSSGNTKQAIWEKYTGNREEHGQIIRWMRQLGYATGITPRRSTFIPMKEKNTSQLPIDSFEGLQMKKRIAELEKQLKDAELKAIAFSTMVDIAEKEFNIPIRKKLNTKPSQP